MTYDEIATIRTDFLEFVKYMFKEHSGHEMLRNDHQDKIANALERVVIGETSRLIINICPRSGKTEIAVKMFIAWCMGNFPDSEFIHATYSKRLATANTYGVRALMMSDAYRKIFGEVQLADDSKAKDEFRTSIGGIVYATGAYGTITGYGAGKMRDEFGGAIIIDDPHKASEFASDTMRNNVIDWFSVTLESRKNNTNTPIILIMQRGHEDDLSGHLLDGGNGEDWEHLCIPAENKDGSSFWPKQFPDERLKQIKKSNSYVYAGQYLQTPSPAEGGIFKDSYWQYYKTLPELSHRIIFADTAQKTKEQNDYSVFQCWGYTKNNRKYLIDQIRGKWESPDLLSRARAFFNKHKSSAENGKLRGMHIEDKASGTGLIQTLKREGITVRAIQRNVDKVTRALDAAPEIEAGFVYLPENSDFLSDYVHEFSMFPNGKHDDQVDATIDAVTSGMQQRQVRVMVL